MVSSRNLGYENEAIIVIGAPGDEKYGSVRFYKRGLRNLEEIGVCDNGVFRHMTPNQLNLHYLFLDLTILLILAMTYYRILMLVCSPCFKKDVNRRVINFLSDDLELTGRETFRKAFNQKVGNF